jgi:lysylphosphatidylglycerol synthetase-like protein (DUF2156 family)
MLDAFYGAFSPACLALLGLWLVAVQMRADEVRASRELRRRTYAVALFFALPGLMGVIALIDTANPAFWRVSFVIISLVGAAALLPVRGLPGGARVRDIADIAAVMLYLAIAVLAVIGGADMQRTVAVLLTALVFLGFNVAWLFLFEPLAVAETVAHQEQPEAPATGR